MSQKAHTTLLRYLIPDLANMVLEYCWKKENIDNIEISIRYGNYEAVKKYISRGNRTWHLYSLLKYAYREKYKKIVVFLERETMKHPDYTTILYF